MKLGSRQQSEVKLKNTAEHVKTEEVLWRLVRQGLLAEEPLGRTGGAAGKQVPETCRSGDGRRSNQRRGGGGSMAGVK